MTKTRAFWDRIAQKYAATAIGDMASYEYKLEKTRALFRPDMKVLEFGAGTGSTAILHAPHVAEYWATDLSQNMMDIACAKDGADQVRFEVADFDTLAVDPGSQDMILGMSIIHLMEDPQTTITKAFASLKPGGYLVTSTVCLGRFWFFKPLLSIGQALGRLPNVRFLREDAVRDMMTSAGFEIIEDWQPDGKIRALFLIAKKPG